MPQFDFYSFSVQIFWVLISFVSFYFIFIRILFVIFSESLKFSEKINNLLKK